MIEARTSHPIGPEDFRTALANQAAGVVVITTRVAESLAGLTVTSFTSVSLAPPLVSFYVDGNSATLRLLRVAPFFVVNILADHQADVARRFAAKGLDRFEPADSWYPAEISGLPLVKNSAARLICSSRATNGGALPIGDHVLLVGEVVAAEVDRESQPLLYRRGRFGRFVDHEPTLRESRADRRRNEPNEA
ncbi:flavin reductase family protein [Nonomuraea sp. NPDC050786]|uniref:flavin reductase family protein n=1 Tax=Nonomuraea sp. NPDC050786 TaxID=3154840 RepID=UPI0033DDEEF2